ncbi:saxiphilin-like [Haliotis cracherodii]|uniref:saxiphilin-like n=1 Tax=Haliotis cracherodii TaxID=6455 RepID=UPI0039ED72D5
MLLLLVAACGFLAAEAIVCAPDMCKGVDCPDVTGCNGKVKANGGFCGCCDSCVNLLGENDKCSFSFLLGVPSSAECGVGLHCSVVTRTCVKMAKRQVALGPCALKQQQLQQGQSAGLPLLGVQSLKCNQDGSYNPVQCLGSGCYCVDSAGVEIAGYRTSIGATDYSTKNCQCARDKEQFSKTGALGQTFDCESNGNYQQYKCEGSVCFCTDDNGKMIGTQKVSIGLLSTLKC